MSASLSGACSLLAIEIETLGITWTLRDLAFSGSFLLMTSLHESLRRKVL